MIGERIKNARLASGLSLAELADRLANAGVNLTKAALSKYEREKSTPNAVVIRALGEVLGVDAGWFLRETCHRVVWGDFRKTTRLRRRDEERIKAVSGNLVEHFLWLEGALLKQSEVLFTKNRRKRVQDVEEAEKLAEDLRAQLELGSHRIDSLSHLLEAHGVVILGFYLSSDSRFDGLSAWIDDKRPLMLINLERSVDRLRYNIAHELGHLVMECDDLEPNARELLAHRFAAAFLVPKQVAYRELGACKRRNLHLSELGILKMKYGLSIQAWVRRAYDIGVISQSHYQSLFREISAKKWRKAEPSRFDYRGCERPLLLKQYCMMALSEGIVSRDKISQICPDAVRDLEVTRLPTPERLTARELRKLSKEDRARRLRVSAEAAIEDYDNDKELTAFEAYSSGGYQDDFL